MEGNARTWFTPKQKSPLYPRKQTFVGVSSMSALGQTATKRSAAKA